MPQSNPLRDNFFLPLSFTEAVYVRGALRRCFRDCKAGDEKDYLNQVLVRLEQFMYDTKKYGDLPF